MSDNQHDLVGKRVRVSTSGPTIACKVVGVDGESGGEVDFIVEDLHKGHQFTIRQKAIDVPDEEWEDTLYIWQERNFDTGEWDTKYSSRDRDEVEEERSDKWSASGAGGTRIKEETITL